MSPVEILIRRVRFRENNIGGNAVSRTHLLGNDGAEGRIVHRGVGPMTSHHVVMSLAMVILLSVHRAYDSKFIHVLGSPRQQFGNLDPRYVRGNRLKRAVGFGVPHINMARSSI